MNSITINLVDVESDGEDQPQMTLMKIFAADDFFLNVALPFDSRTTGKNATLVLVASRVSHTELEPRDIYYMLVTAAEQYRTQAFHKEAADMIRKIKEDN